MGRTKKEPIEQLRALDRAFAQRGVSADTREAVRRRLQRRAVEQPFHARLRWWPAFAFTAGAIMMGALLLPRGDDPTPERDPLASLEKSDEVAEPAKAVSPPSPPAPVEPACVEPIVGPMSLESDACAWGDGVRVSALLPSQFTWSTDAVELRSGELLFDVSSRPLRPLHVTFGEVDIEVVGTRFIVHHDGTEGWISMLEGHVRARVGDEAPEDLRAGQRLQWPAPRAQGGSSSKRTGTKRTPKPTTSHDDGLAELLEEVSELRRRGAYAEAVERLESSDTRGFGRRARQLVSYEIGTLLERQLGDSARACAHWAEHRRRYPKGRHDAIVARSMDRLHCVAAGE